MTRGSPSSRLSLHTFVTDVSPHAVFNLVQRAHVVLLRHCSCRWCKSARQRPRPRAYFLAESVAIARDKAQALGGVKPRGGQAAVERMTISFTSTSAGCSMTKRTVRPLASGCSAMAR